MYINIHVSRSLNISILDKIDLLVIAVYRKLRLKPLSLARRSRVRGSKANEGTEENSQNCVLEILPSQSS